MNQDFKLDFNMIDESVNLEIEKKETTDDLTPKEMLDASDNIEVPDSIQAIKEIHGMFDTGNNQMLRRRIASSHAHNSHVIGFCTA